MITRFLATLESGGKIVYIHLLAIVYFPRSKVRGKYFEIPVSTLQDKFK